MPRLPPSPWPAAYTTVKFRGRPVATVAPYGTIAAASSAGRKRTLGMGHDTPER